MPALLLDPPTTEEALRAHAATIERDLAEALAFEQRTRAVEERDRRVAERARWFEELRGAILALVRSPAWRAHDLARGLMLTLEDLRAAIESDPDALDPEWKEREALMRMRVVVQAMVRQLDHEAIDNPVVAAQLVAEELGEVEPAAVARLLGISTKSLDNWRRGRVEQIKRNPQRVVLIGQLVYELRDGMTPRGVLMWFDRPREQWEWRSAQELIDADVADAAGKLLPLARGGRAQLDV